MKVNTDSIVLGSWALSLLHNDKHSSTNQQQLGGLDIGSGSGLLSLMLAQGFCGDICIDAVELNAIASGQGSENVKASPWPDAIASHCADIRQFIQQRDTESQYDVIISNPPYFPPASQPTKAYLKQTTARLNARNQQSLPLDQLMDSIVQTLAPTGLAFLAIPISQQVRVIELARTHRLSVSHSLQLKSRPDKLPYLACLAMSKMARQTDSSDLIIYQSNNVYTDSFRHLCANFYQHF